MRDPQITDLITLLRELEQTEYISEYIKRFEDAATKGDFDAFGGTAEQERIRNKSYVVPTYVVLRDERFDAWHAQTLQALNELGNSFQRPLRSSEFRATDPAMLKLLAARFRASRKVEQKQKGSGKRRSGNGEQASATTDTERNLTPT